MKTKESPKAGSSGKHKKDWSEAEAFRVLKKSVSTIPADTPAIRKIKKFVDGVESLYR